MEFVFEGIVFSILPEQSGTSARGEWHSQNVVFEMQTNSNYPRKVSVKFFNKHDDVARLVVGAAYKVTFDVESREYQGRWYTDVLGRRVEPKEAAQMAQPQSEPAPFVAPAPAPTPAAAPMPTEEFAVPAQGAQVIDDLPF
ncbi:MAG: DUF3127 domain-containing protein [Alistipes sp.]|nr:DUF3127 domain-containing protein [Rikenellaceae bacterium]MBR1962509.1 DUF3127 domain-containing protein [Alistipes sp.]